MVIRSTWLKHTFIRRLQIIGIVKILYELRKYGCCEWVPLYILSIFLRSSIAQWRWMLQGSVQDAQKPHQGLPQYKIKWWWWDPNLYGWLHKTNSHISQQVEVVFPCTLRGELSNHSKLELRVGFISASSQKKDNQPTLRKPPIWNSKSFIL